MVTYGRSDYPLAMPWGIFKVNSQICHGSYLKLLPSSGETKMVLVTHCLNQRPVEHLCFTDPEELQEVPKSPDLKLEYVHLCHLLCLHLVISVRCLQANIWECGKDLRISYQVSNSKPLFAPILFLMSHWLRGMKCGYGSMGFQKSSNVWASFHELTGYTRNHGIFCFWSFSPSYTSSFHQPFPWLFSSSCFK